MKSGKFIIATLALVLTALLFFFLNRRPLSLQSPIQIGTNVWPGYEPIYLARAKGFFDDTQVRLIEYPNASEVIRGFRNGVIQGAALTLDEVFLLIQDNIPLKVILIMDISNGGDVILAAPPIKSVKGLKGKRVGVESSALGALVLSRALEKNGMTIEDLQVVNIVNDEHAFAYQNRQIDAVVTFEPTRTNLLKQGATQIFSSAQIPGEIVDVLVVSQHTLETHRNIVDHILEAWFEATQYMEKYPQESAKIMAQRENVTPQQFLTSLDGLIIPDWEENRRLLTHHDNQTILESKAIHLRNTMLKLSLLDREISLTEFIDDTFFKEQP